jgi:hypothetical protein
MRRKRRLDPVHSGQKPVHRRDKIGDEALSGAIHAQAKLPIKAGLHLAYLFLYGLSFHKTGACLASSFARLALPRVGKA